MAEIGILSNETVAELAEFDNVLNRIKTGFKTAGSEMGASLLPVMETFAKILEEKILPLIRRITEGFSNLGDGTKTAIIGTLAFVAALAPLLLLIGGRLVK